MQTIFNKIEELLNEIKTLPQISSENLKRLNKKFRLEFNYNSNHLEGNTLTYGETELLLFFDKTDGLHELRELEEMKAHDVAYKIIQDWAKDIEHPLTETYIKQLNEIILVRPFWKEAITPDGQSTRRQIKVGQYKEHPNSVRLQNGEMFEYASPTDTPIKMNELIRWYNAEIEKDELHPVALAALLHYKFVCIHPFDDGNGRISRLLMNYVLLKNNLPPIIIKTTEKKKYLNALNQADVGNIEAFVNYIAEQLLWSLELTIKAMKGESIEEIDDYEKEIAIWKKQVIAKEVNSLHRNDELIYELYQSGIAEMFINFANKHIQFDDLFNKKSVGYFKNNTGDNGINYIEDEMNRIEKIHLPVFYREGEVSEIIIPDDTFQNLWIGITFQEYKYNEINSFNITSNLELQFEPYNYIVKHNNLVLYKRNYGNLLSKKEMENIVTDSIKRVFEEIKKNDN